MTAVAAITNPMTKANSGSANDPFRKKDDETAVGRLAGRSSDAL